MWPENNSDGQETPPRRSFIEEARRAQIIGAAITTIAETGFDAASLAQIAARAGISKGVISYHFAGKDELMEQVVTQVYTSVTESTLPRVLEQESAIAMLRTHILTIAAYMRDHREQLMALREIFTKFRTPEGRPHYGITANEGIYEALEGLYRAGQDSGEFRPFDTRVMAVSQQAGIDSMFDYWATHPDHDLDIHARELADLFEYAVRPQSPGP
ncbi:TetR/AcrR family transcriptional regulator [Nocardiopsis ansamitocini]|uniref:TetR family transcriptional regulator n=1 Tax=Nocardiopsis ansamitocini TaxID=1670832 RepID=A0A9W6PA05_9ACTN|nr:TetR/AcrR family transcriptional regulator [Nocardiopsis ansamitocini]GLU49752.1 TetR family transcriptional regulator [Nocardiopsis ansamitocini]